MFLCGAHARTHTQKFAKPLLTQKKIKFRVRREGVCFATYLQNVSMVTWFSEYIQTLRDYLLLLLFCISSCSVLN
jgi:hypothetical protein